MKQKHWQEHQKDLQARRDHKERTRANAVKRRGGAVPHRRPGLYALAGGEKAAVEWFRRLSPEEQTAIVSPSPDGSCRRGRGKVIRAFQAHLVRERDRLNNPVR